jgi:hypothetical protein
MPGRDDFFALLLQLPAGLPRITILEIQQTLYATDFAYEIFKISGASWATVKIFRSPG